MDEAELNSLVSPCKRLKLQSPGKPMGQGETESQAPDVTTPNEDQLEVAKSAENEMEGLQFIDESTDGIDRVINNVEEICDVEVVTNHDEASHIDSSDGSVKLISEVLGETESDKVCVSNDKNNAMKPMNESFNKDRMFCVSGEPVNSADNEVKANDTLETHGIVNVESVQESHIPNLEPEKASEVKEGKPINLVMHETDLDATLTSDNVESFHLIENNPETCETEGITESENNPNTCENEGLTEIKNNQDNCETECVAESENDPDTCETDGQTEELQSDNLCPVDDTEEQTTCTSPQYPIEPSVNILPVSIKKWLNDNADDRAYDYPVLSSFKPQFDRQKKELVRPDVVDGGNSCSLIKNGSLYCSNGKGSNSVPLLTSTPIIKAPQGLKMRDMNIIRSENQNDNKLMKPSRNIQELIEAENAHRNVYYGENEREVVNVKNAVNVEHSNKKIEAVQSLKRDRESKREKRKMKGTRIQKYKEYVGPGLTSNLSQENQAESSKLDFVKNTDIQTCTLTEYKGFGLTGPLPDKPLMASTPMPKAAPASNVHALGLTGPLPDKPLMASTPMPKAASASNVHALKPENFGLVGLQMPNTGRPVINAVGHRPAGTEGMILSNFLPKPQMQSTAYPVAKDCVQTSNNQSGSKVPLIVKGSCSGQRSLTDHSANCNSGTSSALQPDDVYPSRSSSHDGRSENNSNTDKSDRSEKLVDPLVLQSKGQLKVSAYMNFGLLTVHVVQARQLTTKWKPACDSFVKISLIPDDGTKPKCKTDIIQDSNNPLYDEKFSFELTDEDHSKRLMISVWHRDQSASVNEFLGCMSFGIRHLTNPKKEVSGWYYLLTEDIGRKKHLQVSHRQQRPHIKARGNHSNIPSVNKDVWGTESLQLTLHRGKNGFGFSVMEACPVRVGRVDGASPAETARLQPGDIIVRLNRQNVSRSTATSVAKLIKHSSNTLLLELHRPKPVTLEHDENSSFWQIPSQQDDRHSNPADPYHYDDSQDLTAPQMYTIHDGCPSMKESEYALGDMTVCSLNPNNMASLATSTPLPLLARGHRTVHTSEVRKQEAIHRLLSLELDFIDLMHCGMQRYSRPLRHCILSHSQHTALFQNIEKLTTISEYHVKQMHDNAPSSFMSEDTDTSASSDSHNFILSIGLIYQSKVHMLCQAYDLYAKGIGRANSILSELRHNSDFAKFVREAPSKDSQPSISAFIYKPVQHIRELFRVVQEIFLNTNPESSDYNSLKKVVEGLQECANTITNYSNCCERGESVSSLTSRDSKTSSCTTSSMKSRSSSSSQASSCSRGQGQGSCVLGSSKSTDLEVMKIQDRLVFSSNVPVFQLCQDDRHLIFSGDMFKWEGHQWAKISLFLFTDMLLQTVHENDGYLRVTHDPIMLRDVVAMDAQRHHGTELVLYIGNNGQKGNKKCSFRAPSTEQKYAWKSLIEQRVFAVRGSLEYYSSTSDVSSGSASAIVI